MLYYYSVMKANIKKEEPGCAQMTIFYDGKVIVFDDIPAEKVKDIMVFCTKGTATSRNHSNNFASTFAQSHPSFLARNFANNSAQIPSTPVIYGKKRKNPGYLIFERVLDLCNGFIYGFKFWMQSRMQSLQLRTAASIVMRIATVAA